MVLVDCSFVLVPGFDCSNRGVLLLRFFLRSSYDLKNEPRIFL